MPEDTTAAVPPWVWEDVVALAIRLPEVEEGTSYGTPSLRVRGRLFARLWEDGETLVLKTNLFARRYLLDDMPDTFFLTDHYLQYPYILARLSTITAEQLTERLDEAWRLAAPKRLVARFDRRDDD